MKTLELPISTPPRSWGREHGERFREEIRELAEIRLELCLQLGRLDSVGPVLEAARAHLPILESFDRALYDELRGIAEGADIDPGRIVVLNHYTDLRDLPPDWEPPTSLSDSGCTIVFARTSEGPVLAQTWDIHGSALPFVIMLHVPGHDTPQGPVPEAWVLSITGCLGMCGMNQQGLSVAINNLWSLDARVGIVWSALVRKALATQSASAARDVILSAPIGSGHHYVVADRGGVAYGIETSGRRLAVVYNNAGDDYIHTNHCFSPTIAEVTAVSPKSTTHVRLARMRSTFKEDRPDSMAAVWRAFGTDETAANRVCWPTSQDPETPNAVATCAIVLMDPTRGELWAQQGWGGDRVPTVFRLGVTESEVTDE